MIQNPGDLVVHDADVLGTQWWRHAHQLFDRHDIGMLVTHHRHVIESIHVRQCLQESAVFGELFGCAMQEADVRISALDNLAVELQDQSQHAVRGWVLRTKVQSVVLDLSHD